MDTYAPPTPVVVKPSSAGPTLRAIGLIAAGVVVGAAAMWYAGPSRAPQAVESPSPSPSSSAAVSASPSPVPAHLPVITFRQTRQPKCVSQAENVSAQWDVLADGAATGTTVTGHACEPLQPKLIRQGQDWAVIEVPFTGLGGYIVYLGNLNVQYVNFKAKTSFTIKEGSSDFGFSADGRWAAYFGDGMGGLYLYVFDLEAGATAQVSALLPGQNSNENTQPGLPTYSPDGKKIAVVIWYGPDNERGEIYTGFTSDLSFWTKVADTPTAPRELFWKADGTVGWK